MAAQSVTRRCEFVTERLVVGEWHLLAERTRADLAVAVTSILTEAATRPLPAAWRGPFTLDRSRDWIRERDDESVTLLVMDRASRDPVGLVILFEILVDDGPETDVRLGYVLAEAAWGRGLASELVEGFVSWVRAQSSIRSIGAGVERDNAASARVLTKNGFTPSPVAAEDELIFELWTGRAGRSVLN